MHPVENVLNTIEAVAGLGEWFATRRWIEMIPGIDGPPVLTGRESVELKPVNRLFSLASGLVDDDGEDALHMELHVQASAGAFRRMLVIFYHGDMDGVFSFQLFHDRSGSARHELAVAFETISRSIESKQQAAGMSTRLPTRVLDWLMELQQASQPQPPAAKNADPTGKWLAYCLIGKAGEGDVAGLRLETHAASETKKGAIKIYKGRAAVDLNRLPAYINDEDLPLLLRYHKMLASHDPWAEGVPVTTSMEAGLLDAMLATGRLLYLKSGPREVSTPQVVRLHAGGPIDVEPVWSDSSPDLARPILRFSQPSAVLCVCDPARYLDPQSGAFGVAVSPHTARVLAAWPCGPQLSNRHVGELGRKLTERLPHTTLPLPEEEEAVEHAGGSPSGRLRLARLRAGFYQRQHIVLEPVFIYDGAPDLPPLRENGSPMHQWFVRKRRHRLRRDPAAEARLLEMLEPFNLLPLSRFYHQYELTPQNHHALTLGDLTSPTLTDWLNLMENPDFLRLADAGWMIEIDPSGGFAIHDIGDFDAGLEEDGEDGIDWFRFEVTAEFQGRRISLIPHIARAIQDDMHVQHPDADSAPESILLPCDNPADGHIRFPGPRFMRIVHQVRHLFHGAGGVIRPPRLDRLGAAAIADALNLRNSETARALANLGQNLRDVATLPAAKPPVAVKAKLRPYQLEGFRWLQFLAKAGLSGILADDMGLGKTLQTLAHLAARKNTVPKDAGPALIIAPTSVVPNWDAEAARFTPRLKRLVLHGNERAEKFDAIAKADLVITSYPLLVRDFDVLCEHRWHTVVLDEAQYIKNPKAQTSLCAARLRADHRICLSGTPMENHLGELWSIMRFLMPGFLGNEKTFNATFRKAIEKDKSQDAQLALNRRVGPLMLRRTKDEVAADLPEKTHIIHTIDLDPRQADLYESVRATLDSRVREAIADKGLARSHIIVLEALLKLRQICCHPQLLKLEAAARVTESAKLAFLTEELLPTLVEEGRRILLFSQFTSMLELIEECLGVADIAYLKLTGDTRDRASLVKTFQKGETPVFLISLKAGGTGLNLTAADTVIHYDPWWNPAAENQATDRAHRIGQTKPVFVHKLVCRGTIEERILELQKRKAALVEALLGSEATSLRIDPETLSHLLAPLG